MGSRIFQGWFTKSNSITVLLIALIIMMIVFPGIKAKVITGFMKIGFFQPDIPPAATQHVEKNIHPAPDVEFQAEKGFSYRLDFLKGKVVFINFWATWCPPCIAEMPGINRLYQKLNRDSSIFFIMADADGDFIKSGKFMAVHNYVLPLFRSGGSVPGDFFSGTLPTTIVINKKGEIVFHELGVANYDTKKFEDFLKRLAAEK